MNQAFKDHKERMRRLDGLLAQHGAAGDPRFAQALSLLHRATRRGDRTREPTPEMVNLLMRAESLGRGLL
jgi:hypothetical protein